MTATVSIVFLTKNAGERFEGVLRAVENQSYAGDTETLVVDSGSTDGTVERAESFGCEVYHIEPDEFHHSRTRNFGASKSNGDVVVFLTQDATPKTAHWLENLVEPIATDQASVVYGRQIAYPDAKPMDEFFYSYFYPDERRVLTASDASDPRRFYLQNVFVSDVTSAIDRDVWEQVQFRESVAMSEDKDFALRALREGHTVVYEPDAAVLHSHDYDLRSNLRRRYKDGLAYARLASEGADEFVSDGIRYVADELRYLVSNGHARWLPYALAYDFVHFVGFQAGKRLGPHLPRDTNHE
jgi:rhamnosyltransferase